MNFANLTPHAIRVLNPDGSLALEIAPSGSVARVATRSEQIGTLDGVPIFRVVRGAVTGLPDGDGRFIVSLLVRESAPGDVRLFSPGELRRGPDGQPVGCVGLVGNGGGL